MVCLRLGRVEHEGGCLSGAGPLGSQVSGIPVASAVRRLRVFAGCAVLAVLIATRASAQDASAVIAEASRAMGANGLNAITLVGAAAQGNFGQSRTITFGIASTAINNFTRTIDYATSAMRTTGDTVPPTVQGAPPPMPGRLDQTVVAGAPWDQQLQIWVTPWGFLRGAAANAATLKPQKIDGVSYKVVTWMTMQKAPSGEAYKVVGYINAENLVARVQTWVDHPVLGDEPIEFVYTDYRDVGGLKVPTKMTGKQVGMDTFVAQISGVRVNPPNLDELIPTDMRARAKEVLETPPAPLPPVASEKLADGVYRITGGYVSMAIEFRDFVVVLEGGQSEARGLAVLAETKRLFPNKRIKYVVNTHPHFDHASGLPPFAAEGITILCDDNTKYFIEQALSDPRTLVGDALAKSRKKPKVEGVIDKMVIEDSTRRLELHHVAGLQHSDSMLVGYLPKEKILFSADFRMPTPGQPDPSIATLRQNVDRLQLDFDRVVMVHAPNPDRPVTREELLGRPGGAQ
jgi:glyoxylase-like metal-dependent hydrolase (beta-lactamase superfamily II)